MDDRIAPRHRIEELVHEHVDLVPYDPTWPKLYLDVETRLSRSLPLDLVMRIDHIGSTAIPGCTAKPIIDVQVEVTSLQRVRNEVVPIMDDLGYEFIWRPTMGEQAPFYAWFIKRDVKGRR
ncbi:MAG TPA: GrpB family protein, partial [Flavobacteriales bacterium]|nr:GrpB family protein [Flavobacteriales bacterium]